MEQFKTKINSIIISYEHEGKQLTIDQLKNELTGKGNKTQSLLYVFRMHNKDIAQRIGKGYSDATLEKHNLTKYHLNQYLFKNYNSSDQQLSELNYAFIFGFESFMLNDQKNSISSTNKHTQRLKKVVNHAILNEWIDKDPLSDIGQ